MTPMVTMLAIWLFRSWDNCSNKICVKILTWQSALVARNLLLFCPKQTVSRPWMPQNVCTTDCTHRGALGAGWPARLYRVSRGGRYLYGAKANGRNRVCLLRACCPLVMGDTGASSHRRRTIRFLLFGGTFPMLLFPLLTLRWWQP